MQWISVHIYYNNLDKLLKECITPLVDLLERKGLTDKLFFIKYYDDGPHIRFRVKCKRINIEITKSNLNREIEEYLLTSSSQSHLGIIHAENKKKIKLDTFQYVKYDMELGRYGGEVGMQIAQDVFEASSKATLWLLKENKLSEYGDKIGSALQLHFSFAYAFGLSLNEMVKFFHGVLELWCMRSINYVNKLSRNGPYSKDQVLSLFNDQCRNELEILIPHFRSFWDHLIAESDFSEEYINEWISQCKSISKKFNKRLNKGLIDVQNASINIDHIFEENHWAIFQSYFHMTNNRMGIDNKDESYIAFILMKISEVLMKENE
jgi:thiopeptide-type bacteriocin biosynthesis protein